MARAIIVVPPLIKYDAGPMLGPAMLVGAARQHGHEARVEDLAIRWIHNVAPIDAELSPVGIYGDHRKPAAAMSRAEAAFVQESRGLLGTAPPTANLHVPAELGMLYPHARVIEAAEALRSTDHFRSLTRDLFAGVRPDVLGVSVMFSCQVLWAIAVSREARSRWPGSQVVWGGAHVTALADHIARDPEYADAADLFVSGYAETTFCALLDLVDGHRSTRDAWFVAGSGSAGRALGDLSIRPEFGSLSPYRRCRLTLPAQLSRGCAYGRCSYCTYPRIEGDYAVAPDGVLGAAIYAAERYGAALSFKDSLLTRPVLKSIAAQAEGRVEWNGCTKMYAALPNDLPMLAQSGCRTLEIGVETFVPQSQRLVDKAQSFELFTAVLDAAAAARVGLVVNYMVGLPGESSDEATRQLSRVVSALDTRKATMRAVLQVNRFELERLATLARDPRIEAITAWPWSSLLDWQMAASNVPRSHESLRLPVLGAA